MPELLILRHGKSDWASSSVLDRDRPLASRGRAAAHAVGRTLTLMHRRPDLIVTSPAERARATAELASSAGGWEAPINSLDALYGASAEVVLAALRATPPDTERLMVVGHEPVWSELVALIVGGGRFRMVTGAVAAVEVPAWEKLRPGTGQLLWMLAPRLLTDGNLGL